MISTSDSETAVIGALFNIPGWLNRRREQIVPGLFQNVFHQAIVSAALSLTSHESNPDLWAITNHLSADPQNAGIAPLLAELAYPANIPFGDTGDTHLQALRTAYQRRELADAHTKAAELLRDAPLFGPDGENVAQKVDDIMQDAGKMPGKMLARRHVKDIIHDVLDEIQDRVDNPGRLAGISTGIPTLDRKTAGMMKGQVWVFAGLPGDGKSTLMQNCAEAAAYSGHKVSWYPLEMPDTEQVFRLLASGGGVDNERLFSGMLSQGDMAALAAANRRLRDSPIEIVNVDGATAGDIINDIERSDAEIAVVDYLQLMEETSARKGANREEIIASISRRLKRTARRSGKTILTGSQLNDGGKLRESRAIGQDADKIFLINKHPLEGGENGELDDTKRLLWCDKNRGLKRHWELPLHFLGHVFQFKEIPQHETEY